MAYTANQQQMINDAFQSAIYVQNRMDVQHTPIYDTVTLAAGAAVTQTSAAFFTNVGAASNKTLAQTNMTQQNRLAAPQAFSIFGIRFFFAPNILLADAIAMMGQGSTNTGFALSFTMGDKRYQLAPLWYFSAGGGIAGYFTTSSQAVFTNGAPHRESMHKLAIPLVIENQMNFSATLEGNSYTLTAGASGGTGITMTLLLDGLYARGVQ